MRVRLQQQRLRALLARSRLSQNAWAMRVGVSRGHWSDIVNGKHPYPSPKTRQQMLDALDLPFEELFVIESAAEGASGAGIAAAVPGRYVIDRLIGEGGMGTVYEARDSRFGRRVAIKVIAAEAIGGLGVGSFLKEIHRTARLQHPNILPVLDAGEAAGAPYYVTPCVEGGSLRDLLDGEGPLSLERAVTLARGVAGALEHAHKEGLLHCDLKPENVLLAGDHAYVADFGLSRAIHLEALREWDRRPEIDTAAGTPAYVSPEQARAEIDLDPRSDVYSLACVLFEILSGRPPFSGRSTTEVVRRRFDSVTPDLGRLVPGLPPPVVSVVAEAMSVDKRRRPATPAAFIERLELAASADPIESRQVGVGEGFRPVPPTPAATRMARNAASAMVRWAVARTRPRPRGLLMDSLLEDLRFSLRSLRRRPLFASICVLTLALGIGANTAMFSVIHGVVLRPLPFPEPDRLVRLFSTYEGRACCVISAPNFLDLRARTTRFADLVAFHPRSVNVTGGTEPVRVPGYGVSHGLFDLLGASPQLGRFFAEEDDRFGAEPVVVLSDRLWRDRFGADPDVVGESIIIEDVPHAVIGVAPADFRVTGAPRVFLPFAWDPDDLPYRDSNFLIVIGRLAPDSSREEAMSELSSIYASLVREYPDSITNKGVAGWELSEWLVGESRRRPLFVLWGAVTMVLLVACANVANLMLARAETRQRELAVRAALGAGRARLVRHFLNESLLVSVAGATVGVAAAWVGLEALLTTFGGAIPRSDEVGISSGVLLFALAVCLVTALLVGLAPALQTSVGRLQTALREGGRGSAGSRSRLRQSLVVLEVGAALILVVGAGLMLKSFWRLSRVDVGVDAARILSVSISLPETRYQDETARIAFFENLQQELTRLPPVEGAGLVSAVPFSGTHNNYSRIMPVGEPELEATFVEIRAATAEFFSSLDLALLAGRHFASSDNTDAQTVVIVNRELTRQLFPDRDPIGRYITPDQGDPGFEIIGVVEDLREHGPDRRPPPTVYFPFRQSPRGTMSLTARVADDPLEIVPDVRRIARQLDPELPLFDINRLDQLIYGGLASRRFSLSLLSIFAGVALALGAIGIYGVMAYAVERRTREIGLRQALGASHATVLRLVISQGIRLAAVGILVGGIGAYLIRQAMTSLLFEVSSLDPAVYITVAGILALVAAAACFVPAHRAAAVDPMVALRDE